MIIYYKFIFLRACPAVVSHRFSLTALSSNNSQSVALLYQAVSQVWLESPWFVRCTLLSCWSPSWSTPTEYQQWLATTNYTPNSIYPSSACTHSALSSKVPSSRKFPSESYSPPSRKTPTTKCGQSPWNNRNQ